MDQNTIIRPDHDLLIRVETKLDQALVDVKDLKDGVAIRLNDIEHRVDLIEQTHIQFNTKEMKERLTDLMIWKRDQQVTWKVTLTIASLIGSVFGFMMSQISNIFELINQTHR